MTDRIDVDEILAAIYREFPELPDDDSPWESFNVCTCNRQGKCVVCLACSGQLDG